MNARESIDRAALDEAVLCWPGEREAALRGWSLRTGSSPSLRANSAFPYAPDADLSEEALGLLELFFRDRARVPAVRVVPFGPTRDLDGRLAEAGYDLVEPTLVLTAPLVAPSAGMSEPASGGPSTGTPDARPPDAPALVELDDEAWLAALAHVADQPARVRGHYAAVLPRAPSDRVRLALTLAGRPIAVLLGLVVDGRLGLFDLVVAPDHRGRGHARRLLRAGLAEGARRGARSAFLYATADNERALALYVGLGFREAYGYHYRVLR